MRPPPPTATRRALGALLGLAAVACGQASEPAGAVPEDTTPGDAPAPRTHTPPPPAAPEQLFRDVSEWAGLTEVLPGQGATWLDVDGDGIDDVVLPGREALVVLRNTGDGWLSEYQRLPHPGGWGAHAFAIDLTADGRPEVVYLLGRSLGPELPPGAVRPPDELILARGAAGLEVVPGVLPPGAQKATESVALFADLTRDGRVDLLFTTFGPAGGTIDPHSGKTIEPQPDRLLERIGGIFVDHGAGRGLDAFPTRALAGIAVDLDDDGVLEALVGTDEDVDVVLEPTPEGGFVDLAPALGLTRETAAMGFAVGDVDGDLDMDLFTADNSGHALQRRRDDGTFETITDDAGLSAVTVATAWGCALEDLDNDGDLDLFVTAGGACSACPGGEEGRLLFWNDGTGHFTRATPSADSGLAWFGKGRSAAVSDMDADGDLDLLLSDVGLPAMLLRNELPPGRHWLDVELSEPDRWPSIGAVVTLHAGGRAQRRWVAWPSGYGGSGTARLHFGLGDTATVDRVEVRWPDGTTEERLAPPADGVLRVTRSVPTRAPAPAAPLGPGPTPDCDAVCDAIVSCGVAPRLGLADGAACTARCAEEPLSAYAAECVDVAPCDAVLGCMSGDSSAD